jgi:hypothetical protein
MAEYIGKLPAEYRDYLKKARRLLTTASTSKSQQRAYNLAYILSFHDQS